MTSNFILVANGRLNMPQLEINVQGTKAENATELAKLMVVNLVKADYHTFVLYDVSKDEDHKQVARFAVEQPAPIVTVR